MRLKRGTLRACKDLRDCEGSVGPYKNFSIDYMEGRVAGWEEARDLVEKLRVRDEGSR